MLYTLSLQPFKEFLQSGAIHKQWSMNFSFTAWANQFSNVDRYLNMVTPLFHKMGFVSLLFPLLYLVAYWRKAHPWKKVFVSAYILLLVASFGINKIADGDADLLFPYSRFYLSVGFINVFILARLLYPLFGKWPKIHWPAMTLAASFAIFTVLATRSKMLPAAEKAGRNTYAAVKTSIKDLKKNIDRINEIMCLNPDYTYCTLGHMLFAPGVCIKAENPDFYIVHSNAERYFWIERKMADTVSEKNVIFIPVYDGFVKRAKKDKPDKLRTHKQMDYFLEKGVSNWYRKRDEYFKD